MEWKHEVWHFDNEKRVFVKVEITDTVYYSLGPYQPGDDDVEEIDVQTLGDLYLMWQDQKKGDKECGESGIWKYHFYRHEIRIEPNRISSKPEFMDYVDEIKIYRRGNKIFFK